MTDKKRNPQFYFIALLIGVIPLFALGLSDHGLWSADEPRVAEIGREMALTGNWAVPMLNQRPFLEEPPLYYGALALTFKALGVSDKVARIPSALFGFGTVLVLFFLANSLFGPRVALLSGFILATCGEYFRVAHWIVVDSALTFFVMSAMALFLTGYLGESGRKKLWCYVLVYVAATLAFYTKGFIGIVIPGLGILAFLAVERNLKEILRMRLWLGVLIFFAMTLPWFLSLYHQAGWQHLKVFFVHNHLQRFFPAGMAGQISGEASGHHHPFYYYLTEFPNGFLPWSILIIPVLVHAFSRQARGIMENKGRLFALCWFFAGIVFLSIASTKRTLYLMPIFAPVSMLTAWYIDSTITSGSLRRIGRVFAWVFVVLLFLIGIGLTPALFYAKAAVLPALPGSLLAFVVFISVLSVIITVAGFLYLLRENLTRFWLSIAVPVFLILLLTMVAIVPILDKFKSFVPFSNQVTALVPSDKPLYAYKPDETLRGAVPFYTGRFVTEIEEIDKDLLAKETPYYVMIRDKREQSEKELLSTGKLNVMVKQFMGSDRALVLLTNQPVQHAVTIGEPVVGKQRHKGHGGNR